MTIDAENPKTRSTVGRALSSPNDGVIPHPVLDVPVEEAAYTRSRGVDVNPPVRRRAMLMAKRSFATLSLLACVSASAADDTLLTGHLRIGGRTLHDAPPGERHDTHAYFEITGASARALYASMKVRAEPDACGDPGTLAKRIRNL